MQEGVITLIEQEPVAPIVVETTPLEENKPLTEPTDDPLDDVPIDTPASVEEDEYDLNFSEVVAPSTGKRKITASSLKEVDEDLSDDDDDFEIDEIVASKFDKILSRTKEYKEKANQYKNIAEANQTIKNDPQLKAMKEFADQPDKDLVLIAQKNKLVRSGMDAATAQEEAEAYVNRYDDSEVALRAKDLRVDMGIMFNDRAKILHEEIAKSAEALTLSKKVNPELITNATAYLDKVNSFMGLNIGSKVEADRVAFNKPIKAAIKNGDVLKAMQEDPKFMAEAAILYVYKNKLSETIKSRKTPRTKVLEELSDAPASNGAAAIQRTTPTRGGILKDPKGFK